ncbi:hypothetical protein LSAT2_014633 [Lamellibrachia satsuma]|nr:hypothetical protein LSAT2_014633 [Lamellibrachia satsuma]
MFYTKFNKIAIQGKAKAQMAKKKPCKSQLEKPPVKGSSETRRIAKLEYCYPHYRSCVYYSYSVAVYQKYLRKKDLSVT